MSRPSLLQSIFDNNVKPYYNDLTDVEVTALLDEAKTRERNQLLVAVREHLVFNTYHLTDELPAGVVSSAELLANDSFYDLVGLAGQALVGQRLTVAQVREIVADALPDYVFGWKKYLMDEVYAQQEDRARVTELQSMSLSQFQQYVKSPRHGALTATIHILSSYFNVHIIVTAPSESGQEALVLSQPLTGARSDNFIVIEQTAGPGTLRSYNYLFYLKLSGYEYAVLSTDMCSPKMCAFFQQRQPKYMNAYKTGPPL